VTLKILNLEATSIVMDGVKSLDNLTNETRKIFISKRKSEHGARKGLFEICKCQFHIWQRFFLVHE